MCVHEYIPNLLLMFDKRFEKGSYGRGSTKANEQPQIFFFLSIKFLIDFYESYYTNNN